MKCSTMGKECPDPEACLQGQFSCDHVWRVFYSGGKPMAQPGVQLLDFDESDENNAVTDLTRWWIRLAAKDADAVIPKAVEYGGADFDIMGAAMLGLKPELWDGADAAERLALGREMAIMFYALGKVARAMSAYGEGRKPSDDTLADLARYAMMARRVRETGKWV